MIPNSKSNKSAACEAVSSNCVVWQGPDLTCVDVCQGDSISDVIAAMCEQLVVCCDAAGIKIFQLNNINQSTLSGGPATTHEGLIQLMIDDMNSSKSGSGSSNESRAGWDCTQTLACVVPVDESLRTDKSGSEMTLGLYLGFLATRISQNIAAITTLNTGQSSNQRRIEALESTGAYVTPTRVSSCNLAGGATTAGQTYPIDSLLGALDTDYCTLRNATGEAGDIQSAVSAQPAGLVPLSKVSWPSSYRPSPSNGGQSLANAWAVVDDLRDYVTSLETRIANIEVTCCATNSMLRMPDSGTLFYNNTTCATACTSAATASGGEAPSCYAIWNSSGVLFDANVKAYLDSSKVQELINGVWYALCPGSPVSGVAQYNTTYPYWRTPSTCETCSKGE